MSAIRLECLGEACPIPLIKAQKKMAALKAGEVMIVETDHSCALKNVPEWAIKEGYHVEVTEVDAGLWEIYIKKTK
jgi:TusA-related sulfurtransferase